MVDLGMNAKMQFFELFANLVGRMLNIIFFLRIYQKNEAQIIEAYLIRKWKTNHHSYGYNTIMPKIVIPDGYVLPELHKKRVFDDNHISEEDRVKRRLHNRNNNQNNCGGAHYNAKMVFCIELDEVFPSVTQAAIAIGVSPANIRHCLSGKQQSAGTHYYTGIPLHWEYVNKNKELKG